MRPALQVLSARHALRDEAVRRIKTKQLIEYNRKAKELTQALDRATRATARQLADAPPQGCELEHLPALKDARSHISNFLPFIFAYAWLRSNQHGICMECNQPIALSALRRKPLEQHCPRCLKNRGGT